MTIQTSWEMMQQYRAALDLAKWRKQVRAEHLEQIRNATEYMRSLRQWLDVASSNKTLKARKAELVDSLARERMVSGRKAALYWCCEIKLVGDSCQSNLRTAISWAETATSSPTFKDWQECCDSAELFIADALVQLDVVLCKFKSLWKQAKADMTTARSVIDTCAKDILYPVALSKQEKAAIRSRVYTAKKMYYPAPANNYHLVSAAACISQRKEGTVLSTKNWLRLVRTTRSNHVHRNSHNLNNRQDYLVRLPVDTNKVICLR